ncbi:MAG: hypothetical protein QOJ39_1668 [Candidatus Eremiobacteraeota bacterium]|nr:hypothetical protein [Candidatus Eremiobacteraeota bacterium]MEA2719804.1 hypothetical protein [Candidatus Eremiobacteraeota bacterium]
MIRLLAAAGAFTGTVVGGFLLGLLLARVTGASWWPIVGLFGGLAVGIGAVAVALRPFLRSN